MTPASARDKIIFALDVDCREEISRWATLLSDRVGMFKVGKELFTSCGPEAVELVKRQGGQVFLDLKYHDIPNTVAQAMVAAGRIPFLPTFILAVVCVAQTSGLVIYAAALTCVSAPPFLTATTNFLYRFELVNNK